MAENISMWIWERLHRKIQQVVRVVKHLTLGPSMTDDDRKVSLFGQCSR